MKPLPRLVAALVIGFFAIHARPVSAQSTAQAPIGVLTATGGTLVAGDVTFGNFRQLPSNIVFSQATPLNGVANIAASAAVNADGSVSLIFTAINPATGAPQPITAAYLQSIAYDVTVTNPARLLNSVNQDFGPTTTYGFNFLQYREPAPSAEQLASGIANAISTDGTLIFDNMSGAVYPVQFGPYPAGSPEIGRGGVLYSLSDGTIFQGIQFGMFGGPLGHASPLPGGNRASLSLRNFFGALTDPHNFLPVLRTVPPFVLDGIAVKFTLVPASTPVTPIPVALGSIDVSPPGAAAVSLARTVAVDGVSHPGFAPVGGVLVTLTSSNAAALPLPPTITMPQGAETTVVAIGDANVDVPTAVTGTASYNGTTVQQTVTVNPAVPLTINVGGGVGNNFNSLRLDFSLNRPNFSPVVVTLVSGNPALAPLPATVTIPTLTSNVAINVPVSAVPVLTPVSFTYTASFDGVTRNSSFNLPATVDAVTITKAELTVKNGTLKVEAVSTAPNAVLTLFNATTGALLGTMTKGGAIGVGAKFSFQGTVSPVTTLRLKSSLNGTTTSAVAQK